MFVMPGRCRAPIRTCGLSWTASLALGLAALAQPNTADTVNRIYLIAGTLTEHTDKTYPVTLYTVSVDKKLKTVRGVVSSTEGLHSVYLWGKVAFVAHPHIIPSTVSIIHMDDPMLKDDVVFNPRVFDAMSNPGGFFVSDTHIAVAHLHGSSPNGLFPISTNFGDPSKGRLASVASDIARYKRVRFEDWDDYVDLRREGSAGGPVMPAGLLGSTIGSDLGIVVSGHAVVIAPLPSALRSTAGHSVPIWIIASSADYLIIQQAVSIAESNSSKLEDSEKTFVLDRVRGRWNVIQVEGNASRCRLFDSWLAIIVGVRNQDHKASPGRDSERDWETDRLPNVREMYSIFLGKWVISPGVLVLQNLADGRKIRIQAGQEDSEVLRVENDVVLYRVNDSIYQARIVGSELKDTTLIVKDEDVPEIHWAFWAKK